MQSPTGGPTPETDSRPRGCRHQDGELWRPVSGSCCWIYDFQQRPLLAHSFRSGTGRCDPFGKSSASERYLRVGDVRGDVSNRRQAVVADRDVDVAIGKARNSPPSLAKLYQSTSRPADAQVVLAPAL